MENTVIISPDAQEIIDEISDPKRIRKIDKTISLLAMDYRHNGLQSKRYEALDKTFGAKVWQSYIENDTPGAWRLWWYFGPEKAEITVLDLGSHP